ncbi:MAG TPA: carboxypeptidase regulatory-like domain-containing protein [Bryobacteraceae bacterium]|nr:carboxypeptidase regulatory-like domain-containing protein [Bryobacteraceae bacterium]
MKRNSVWPALPAIVLLAGCGGGSPEVKKEPAPAAPSAAADPAFTGSVSGKVVFTGTKPAPRALSMDATPACARMHNGPVYAEDAVIASDGGLKNVFVYIKAGLPKRDYPVPSTAIKLDQNGCIYVPHVLGVMVNQPLEISNSDSTNHNIHPLPKINREWNESQPPKGDLKVKTFPKEEVPPILFKCNVHPWMRAWVGVVSHPYFGVTADDGTFSLKDVPAGEYTVEAWHERFGVKEVKLKVEPKGSAAADFTFKAVE